jgi:hypothetical protein
MLEFIRTFFGLFFWMPTLLLLLWLQGSLGADFHMTGENCKALLLLSAFAAGAIWIKGRSSIAWCRAAFAVLTVEPLQCLRRGTLARGTFSGIVAAGPAPAAFWLTRSVGIREHAACPGGGSTTLEQPGHAPIQLRQQGPTRSLYVCRGGRDG